MPHLNQMERYQIYAYKESGLSLRAIAKHLGRHHSVISRELSRNRDNGVYHAEKAYYYAKSRRTQASARVRVMTKDMVRDVEQCLCLRQWSPRQISGYFAKQNRRISHESIYRYIWEDKRNGGI